MKEFRVDSKEVAQIKKGDQITVGVFAKDDEVKVTGTSKGRGYQGVVKRHRFHGSPASHGHKDQLRKSGSIGATDPARVFKGMRMAGRMGNDQISISGLTIVDIDVEKNILYIKGAVPGARNGLIIISGPGEMKLTQVETVVKPEVIENKTEETVVAEVVENKPEENK
jgi:large subunit ribosomal protein L3